MDKSSNNQKVRYMIVWSKCIFRRNLVSTLFDSQSTQRRQIVTVIVKTNYVSEPRKDFAINLAAKSLEECHIFWWVMSHKVLHANHYWLNSDTQTRNKRSVWRQQKECFCYIPDTQFLGVKHFKEPWQLFFR